MGYRVYNTPILDKIPGLFSEPNATDLHHTYVFACQHILEPKERMFSAFVKFGIPQKNIFVIGKAYSTNQGLLEELREEGFQIEQPAFNNQMSFDEQHTNNCEALFGIFRKTVASPARVIVLDDGGGLLSVFNDHFKTLDGGIEIVGIEQTSSGFRRLEKQILKFPIINVARSAIKLNKESQFIAESCHEKLLEKFEKYHIEERRFLIIGLGPVGQALLNQLRETGEHVVGYDIAMGHINLLAKIKETKANVIVGATGNTVLTKEDIETLVGYEYPTYLLSVSSSDREFPIQSYRAESDYALHTDVQYRSITFLNNGFPINFQGNRNEGEIAGIERTICLLMGSVLYLASMEPGVDTPVEFIEVPGVVTKVL